MNNYYSYGELLVNSPAINVTNGSRYFNTTVLIFHKQIADTKRVTKTNTS